MWKRVGRDRFSDSLNGYTAEHLPTWNRLWICKEYELEDERIVARNAPPPWISDGALSSSHDPAYWLQRDPFEDSARLFIDLADLHESKDFVQSALAFVHNYGVPGEFERNANSRDTWCKPQSVYWADLNNFRKVAKKAWHVLRMYEAVLNADPVIAESFSREHDLGTLESPYVDRPMKPGDSKLDDLEIEDWMHLDSALLEVRYEVLTHVNSLCSPSMTSSLHRWGENPDPSHLRRCWDFENLLGAAYLQMYWLMTSDGDIVRCEYCHSNVSLRRPNPDGRKPRSDKRYCSSACKQAHWAERQKQTS